MVKKIFSVACIIIVICSLVACGDLIKFENDGTGDYYKKKDGSYATSEWIQKDNDWYYFDQQGYMLKNQVTPDGYYVEDDGKMAKKKWVNISGLYMYADDDGKFKQSTWIEENGKKYYVGQDGVLKTNTWIDKTYYVNENGEMLKDTITPDGHRVESDGKLAAGETLLSSRQQLMEKLCNLINNKENFDYKTRRKELENSNFLELTDYGYLNIISNANFDSEGNLWLCFSDDMPSQGGKAVGIIIIDKENSNSNIFYTSYADGSRCSYSKNDIVKEISLDEFMKVFNQSCNIIGSVYASVK